MSQFPLGPSHCQGSRLLRPGGRLSRLLRPGGRLSRLLHPGGRLSRLLRPGGRLSRLLCPGVHLSLLLRPGGRLSRLLRPGGRLSRLLRPGGRLSRLLRPGGRLSCLLRPGGRLTCQSHLTPPLTCQSHLTPPLTCQSHFTSPLTLQNLKWRTQQLSCQSLVTPQRSTQCPSFVKRLEAALWGGGGEVLFLPRLTFLSVIHPAICYLWVWSWTARPWNSEPVPVNPNFCLVLFTSLPCLHMDPHAFDQSLHYRALSTRTTRHRNSFFPQAIISWTFDNNSGTHTFYTLIYLTHILSLHLNLHIICIQNCLLLYTCTYDCPFVYCYSLFTCSIFNSSFYYLFFFHVTVILLHCGSFCHKNKFLVCVNIPGNKAHSDSEIGGWGKRGWHYRRKIGERWFCIKVTGRGVGGTQLVRCRLNVMKKWSGMCRGFNKMLSALQCYYMLCTTCYCDMWTRYYCYFTVLLFCT